MSQVNLKSFLFMNIGVIGLTNDEDEEEYTNMKLCVKFVGREQLLSGQVPVDNTVIFNFERMEYVPGQHVYKYHDWAFSEEEYRRLVDYLESFEKPVTLVCYNGYRQMYPILRTAVGHLGHTMPEDLRCIDLMQLVYETENGLGPQKSRDSGILPWEYQTSADSRPYTFPSAYKRSTGTKYDLKNRGQVRGHMEMYVEMCVANAGTYLPWMDTSGNTVFNDGSLLIHEVK